MAQTVTRQYIQDLMREEECPFFTVQDSTQSNKIGEQQDPDVSVEASCDKLDRILDACVGSGTLYITINNRHRKETSKGGDVRQKKFSFRVKTDAPESEKTVQGSGTLSGGMLELFNKNKELEIQLKELQLRREFDGIKDSLQKQIDELKEPAESGVEQYIPHIIAALNGNPMPPMPGTTPPPSSPPPGMGKDPSEEQDPEESRKRDIADMGQILKRLKAIDPDYRTMLRAIIVVGEEQKEQYFQYKEMLKPFAEKY